MKESFEKKPRNIETEADSYEVETTFLPAEVKDHAESAAETTIDKNFSLFYIISKENHKLYLSIDGHWRILLNTEREGLEGGTILVSSQLNIEKIIGYAGSHIKNASPEDFPLVKKLIQKYLDENVKPQLQK